VTPFGATLHVTGRDREALAATAARLSTDSVHRWTRIEPGLEDVFIGLMQGTEDNFQ
jgi:ABC-2 type transport system ATP-binding protein